MFELSIATAQGDELKRYDLSSMAKQRGKLLIGRSEACDIRIKSPAVSRRHCEIEFLDDDEWVVRDLGSTHGCFIGEARVTETEIEPGLEIRVGPAVLRFDSIADRIGAALDRELAEE